jgi:Bacterial membrane protein YfhO
VETRGSPEAAVWVAEPPPWGRADALALTVWTVAIAGFFWDGLSLQKALFYFDITEINLPYRDFLAGELRSGRFARWCPGLYCGFPLYSESQAGYWHPLKYVLYPWMPSWQAFNFDTILSVWLTGLVAYGWLRRHVGSVGALTGASVFGLSGFVWAHLIHTSMANALVSVPVAFWALEATWSSGRLRGMAVGSAALACQVFAGHLQDTLLTGLAIGLYGLYRAATERSWRARAFALGTAAGLVAVGVAIAAVQWVPSKELLDRSPRAGGLTWHDLTYGSWHPELLPTLLVREAYGTRARDTDWMDGFYPYHEMNVYLGVSGLALAILGAAAYRDRWVAFWVLLAGLGGLLMLGRFTCLLDAMNRVPILGSSRIPVRYHLWVSLAAGALAAVGADRLARAGRVRLRSAVATVVVMALVSLPILLYVYDPIWSQPRRWTTAYHLARYRWLGAELGWALIRTVAIAIATWGVATWAARTTDMRRRSTIAAFLPLLVIADLLGAHWRDVPTIDPAYWTDAPESARRILADPGHVRVFGLPNKSAGEPGYASEAIDFLAVRDALGWSLPLVWGLQSSIGETPIIPRRLLRYTDTAKLGTGRFDLESVSHVVLGRPGSIAGLDPPEQAGSAWIHRNPNVLPRARLVARPVYAADELAAARALQTLGAQARDHLVVEDADRPLPEDATSSGRADITRDDPEYVEVTTESPSATYLVLADTFDPGWSATVDGAPAPIRPAYVAFRAVFLPAGSHRVVFTYRPAGFRTGLIATSFGLFSASGMLFWRRRLVVLGEDHGDAGWPRRWPLWALALALAIVVGSAVELGPNGLQVHHRWNGSWHRFTWGAGIEAIRPAPIPVE